MSRILTVLTGGTIGSINRDNVIDVESEGSCRLIEKYCEICGSTDSFDVVRPLNILSENLLPHYWHTLVNFILSYNISEYDGIIITHGSDTLSYSSAMLSMCLCHLPIPVVITAANYVIDDIRSNALNNLKAAVAIIKTMKRGVFTVYGEVHGKSQVFLPTRIVEADPYLDRFSCFDGEGLGYVENEIFEINQSPLVPTKEDIENKRSPFFDKLPEFKKRIILLKPYPGLDYSKIALDESVGAVLCLTYHSGTLRTEGENSVMCLLARCKALDIPMYCCSLKNTEAVYASAEKLFDNGAIPLYNISSESAYAKLLLCCNLGIADKREFFAKNIYFEHIQ